MSFTILFTIGTYISCWINCRNLSCYYSFSFCTGKSVKRPFAKRCQYWFFPKALIAGQFVASIIMIIGTLVIGQQLSYLRNKNLGFDKEHVLIVPTNKSRTEGIPLAERFKEELGKDPRLLSSCNKYVQFFRTRLDEPWI